MPIILLVFVNYARFSKKKKNQKKKKKERNYASTLYFKFGKNTSIPRK